jgi:hypothetical protein
MYRVVSYDRMIERILFRSYSESDCWSFIEQRLNCFIPTIRQEAKHYVVLDSLDCRHQAPHKIYSQQAA